MGRKNKSKKGDGNAPPSGTAPASGEAAGAAASGSASSSGATPQAAAIPQTQQSQQQQAEPKKGDGNAPPSGTAPASGEAPGAAASGSASSSGATPQAAAIPQTQQSQQQQAGPSNKENVPKPQQLAGQSGGKNMPRQSGEQQSGGKQQKQGQGPHTRREQQAGEQQRGEQHGGQEWRSRQQQESRDGQQSGGKQQKQGQGPHTRREQQAGEQQRGEQHGGQEWRSRQQQESRDGQQSGGKQQKQGQGPHTRREQQAGEQQRGEQHGGQEWRSRQQQESRDGQQSGGKQQKQGQGPHRREQQAGEQQRGEQQWSKKHQQGRGHQQGGQGWEKQPAGQQFGGQQQPQKGQPTTEQQLGQGDGKSQQRQRGEQPQSARQWGDSGQMWKNQQGGDKRSGQQQQEQQHQQDVQQIGKQLAAQKLSGQGKQVMGQQLGAQVTMAQQRSRQDFGKAQAERTGQSQPGTATPSMRSASSSSISSVQSSQGNITRGSIGRPGKVGVNYVDIQMDKMPSVAYHYDVTIVPDIPKKFLRPAFEQFNRQFFPKIQMAYDGKSSFYTIQKLPVENATHEVEIDDRGTRKKSFRVTIKETQDSEVDLSSLRRYSTERVFDKPMRALQCLEVVLANPCHNKAVRAGRSFYMKPEQRYDLNDGYEMWLGLYQAAILGDSPFLNVDISHKSFPSECRLVDYIRDNFRETNASQPLATRTIYGLKEFMKSVDIVYEPPANFGSFPRRYRVIDISREPAASLKVTLDNKDVVTVAGYFKSKGYTLKYPNWNCLKVGSSIKSIHIPIELCKVPAGQAINKKDGPRQVQQMIRFSATSTDIRKQKIMTMLSYFKHNLDLKVQGFGIQIGNDFKVVPMRILKSPFLEYFAGEMITPFKGAWRMNDNTKFLQTKQVNNGHQWAVAYSKQSRLSFSIFQNFFGKVSDMARKLNMSLAPKPQMEAFDRIDTTLRQFKSQKYDLVFVVIPKYGTSYAQIKQEAELKVGMLTQCIMENTIERRNDLQTVTNILLKVNGKLNGTNHRINPKSNISLQKVMFLGADVTHPSPDQKHIPSVVGVAASHDANGACYNMQYRLQKSACEEIVDMDSIFSHHLKVYFQYQNGYPNHIIYYRDGVSDGQFPKVRDIELRSIRSACKKVGCNPKLTCIIAIKRHHTRFFPEVPNPRDKFNNVEPGTVIDRVIVHPNEVQFFMVSHQSIQGTAKPTRYNVIVDDANMDINDLQTLTYNLCHMFPRCNRVVSYPAPAYLAHLVAYRGRVYIEGESRFSDPKKEYEKRLVNQDFMRTNPMYFI